ncbi:hypothetical protein [Aquidulcibacter sp.]|jgi:hypothetical protein|uniref:hypothetical protein n=1 Tax=Aquidulcibacter sp. TaxID=2052990 RepID=UPI0028B22B2D|nr:hypothetical protein [Aquidulcibacter sp.]
MSVSVRYIAAATLLAAFMASSAEAGGCNGCGTSGNGTTNIPDVQGPSGDCCGSAAGQIVGVPNVYVPGPNVNVSVGGSYFGGTNVLVGGNTYVGGSTTVVGGGGGGGVYIGGGGGGGFSVPMPATTGLIDGLQVSGGQTATVMEQFQDSRTITETIAIRAVCMDDRGMPHPASRTNGDSKVGAEFDGEVFRCMAGTRMEVTLGKSINGEANFDGGRSISCQKGQALVYRGDKGAVGAATVQCIAQKAEADCNERSLLRRFGPGIKYATITRTETFTNTRQSAKTATYSASMFVDGGVGQGVF